MSDIRVVTNNGWVLFDYVNATNFKFAGADAAGDKWIIGDVINGVKANRAQATQVLNTNTVYPVKVLLEGATVTLINSNAIKVRYTFASLTARPVALGLRGNGTSDFDNIKVCTEAYPTGSVGNPPALPPPTSTAGPADVAAFSYANPPFYYNLNDHLGSTRITTNASGSVTASFEYWPFGEVKSQTGCASNNQKFTGKLFDNESGLQYFGARYLSNDLTRFVSVDPAKESFDPEDPQTWNRYTYSMNDPTNRIDPDGEWSVGWLARRGAKGMAVKQLKRLSKDELKREVRKNKREVVTSKKMARTVSKQKGKKTTHHEAHTKGGEKGLPHYHPEDGPAHVFYKPVAGTPLMIDPDELVEKVKEELFLGSNEDSEDDEDSEEEADNQSEDEAKTDDPYRDEELMKELYGEPTCEGDCPPN